MFEVNYVQRSLQVNSYFPHVRNLLGQFKIWNVMRVHFLSGKYMQNV
jgi:hypothetical protein